MSRRLAYLTLQATREGQAAHAHVHEIVTGLRELGWEVDLFEPDYEGQPPGVLARVLEFRRVENDLMSKLTDYDAVYVRAHPFSVRTSRAAALAHFPSVVECNGPVEDFYTAWPSAKRFAFILESWQAAQYRSADALIAVTPELAEWLKSSFGREEVAVVPNGANTDIFAPGAEPLPTLPDRYVVFFGALAGWQGVETLLAAVKDPAWPADVSLVVAGDGAMRAEVERAARESARVIYAGSLPYADVARAVSNSLASLIVKDLPQHARSGLSPLKLYESMAAGVPVIASDLPGLSDTVKAVSCGIVVPPGDAEKVAEAVSALAADAGDAQAMGQRGHEAALAHHSWKARAADTARVIESVLP